MPYYEGQFCEGADKLPLSAPQPFESTDEKDLYQYLILFKINMRERVRWHLLTHSEDKGREGGKAVGRPEIWAKTQPDQLFLRLSISHFACDGIVVSNGST